MVEQEKILSQGEVDALLTAIDTGDVEVGVEKAATEQATPYDFKRPERVARDQLRAIETLHEVFARNLQTALSGRLRAIVDVSVASVDQLTFSEFINSLPNPTVFYQVSCEPLEGNFIFEINPTIAFPMIERMLGSGRVGGILPARELTDIEWAMMNRIIEEALVLLKEVWTTVAEINFQVANKASNPQLMQIMSPNEPIVMVVMEVTLGDQKGYLNACIPVMSIEPVMEKINTHTWFALRRKASEPGQEKLLKQALSEAEVDLVAHLHLESVRLMDLQGLQPGDLITTSHRRKKPVIISVEGRPKFRAQLGSHRSQLALRVEGPISPSEEYRLQQPGSLLGVRKEGGEDPSSPAGGTPAGEGDDSLDKLLSIPVLGSVVLAEKTMRFRDVLTLKQGDIIEFEKRIEEPLTLTAGGRNIAKGMTVKIGEKFGIQISGVENPEERIKSLGPG